MHKDDICCTRRSGTIYVFHESEKTMMRTCYVVSASSLLEYYLSDVLFDERTPATLSLRLLLWREERRHAVRL